MYLLLMLFACGSSEEAPPNAPQLEVTPAKMAPTFAEPDDPRAGITESQCEEVPDGDPPAGPDCITGVLSCGDTIVGTTKGGGSRYTTKFYESNQCTPATTNHDGGDERVYRFDFPEGDWHANVYLDTPCADLDLAAMAFNGDVCPTTADSTMRCEMWPKPRNKTEKVRLVSRGAPTWYIAVEGKDEEEGAFAIRVECEKGL